MSNRSPSVSAIGIIGRNNAPLHIALFPATGEGHEDPRDRLEYSYMLHSCLDIFEARMPSKTVGHDFGLLHALDERTALYGWLTNTGVKFIVAVDMQGRLAVSPDAAKASILGLRNSDLLPAFQAIQTAYIRLLNNPFYIPDEYSGKAESSEISSPRFIKEIERIGKAWYPGITSM